MAINLKEVPTTKVLQNNELNTEIGVLVPPSSQRSRKEKQLPLFSAEKNAEINGIGMGVLTNGIPYLTQAGLARLCGVGARNIRELTNNWDVEQEKPRGTYIKEILESTGYEDDPYIKVNTLNNDSVFYAFPDVVCMAVLEYYAFENRNKEAIENYRFLARTSLRLYIYNQTGYDPKQAQFNSWKFFHDRVSLLNNKVPNGYFSIFNEIAGLTVDLINSNLRVDEHTIPDISVGIAWAKYWKEGNLESQYGESIKYEHNYPDYYHQSRSNPQPSNAYPVECLVVFRTWLKDEYLIEKFPNYILKKQNLLQGGIVEARKLIQAFNPKLLES